MTTIRLMIRARGECYVTNVPGRGYCFVASVDCAASPYIQNLHGSGDLSC
jgi:DNA-binding winged helix-turn-helix (wHTH) protein